MSTLPYRSELGWTYMHANDTYALTQGLGRKPDVPEPMMGRAYPRELVAHHLCDNMWARVLNIGARPEDGMFGTLDGFRIITGPRYLDERNYHPDCKRFNSRYSK